jgi:Zn-finger nucleic acid-binding protein
MQCPRCGIPLTEKDQTGIQVDTCASCGGVWLDRGELARIRARLRVLEHDWAGDGEAPEDLFRWDRLPRYPRRDPRRRLGRINRYG